ncbi:hypothetical protein AB0D49_06905 [Streptomyces sp. NPDC048290]|uniref:hypothetical protein n=1 Tax=Streptomyces sp. NPDC048290 TaxID=3155811 RepID=UPI003415C78B
MTAPPETPIALGPSATARGLRLQITAPDGTTGTPTVSEIGDGVWQTALRTDRQPFTFTAVVPAVDAVTWWSPGSTVLHATIPPSWADPVDTTALSGIPIGALLLRGDRPGLDYALDARTAATSVRAGLVEETASFVVVGTVSDTVLEQADRAAALGFGTVIVDDGWQTTSSARGYGTCGDWEVATEKFPDPAALVAGLRARGLRTLWWIGTPFAGHSSRLRAEGLPTLYGEPGLDADVLDPRSPATRRHLVDRITHLIGHTGAEGLKLDFLERFAGPTGTPDDSTITATAQLLDEIVTQVASVGQDPLIEFREPYVHPAVARHSTMLRVGDCPLSASQNRVGILDLRLARPGTPIHSDPIMWADDDSAERVAHHLINALPGVPQISMDVLRLSTGQDEALEFWLGVWTTHREVLLHGDLTPERPDLLYPLVTASAAGRTFVCRYAPQPVRLPTGTWRDLLIANGDDSTPLLLDGPPVAVHIQLRDARGRVTQESDTHLPERPTPLPVPSGGLAHLTRAERES